MTGRPAADEHSPCDLVLGSRRQAGEPPDGAVEGNGRRQPELHHPLFPWAPIGLTAQSLGWCWPATSEQTSTEPGELRTLASMPH